MKSKTIFIGHDPGLSGATAFLTPDCNYVIKNPLLPNGQLNTREMCNTFRQFKIQGGTNIRAILEQVHSFPDDGGASVFKFGKAYGTVIGIISCLGIPISFVSPQVWKGNLGLSSNKQQSLDLAKSLFPELADQLRFKKNHDEAEALLLAYYLKKSVEKS
jgi:hypothetical protein